MNWLKDLSLDAGLVFTGIWFLIILLLQRKSLVFSLYSSFIFLVYWCIIALIFHFLCYEFNILCFHR